MLFLSMTSGPTNPQPEDAPELDPFDEEEFDNLFNRLEQGDDDDEPVGGLV